MRVTILLGLCAWVGLSTAHADLIVNANPQAIPDNNPLGLTQTIELSGYTDVIASLEVRLVLSGNNGPAFNGDYFVSLQHDSGYVVLLNRAGRSAVNPFGYGDNGFDVTFTLAGADIHTYQTGIYTLGSAGELTGTWGADGRSVSPWSVTDADPRTTSLSSFTGLSPNGTWTLFVADTSVNGEATLESWSLDVTVVPEPSSLSLILLIGLAVFARRKFRRDACVTSWEPLFQKTLSRALS